METSEWTVRHMLQAQRRGVLTVFDLKSTKATAMKVAGVSEGNGLQERHGNVEKCEVTSWKCGKV